MPARWGERWRENDDGSYTRMSRDEALIESLDALKKPEVVAYAEEHGVDSSGTKAEIIARIEAAQ